MGEWSRGIETYVAEFNESFEYSFVDIDELGDAEKVVYDRTAESLDSSRPTTTSR